MVKVSAPMLSLDASGSIAGAMVFSKWKGRNYVRALVKPANPKSVKQVSVRAMFKFLAQYWTNISDANQATWNDRADDLVVSPFNAFMSANQGRWRNFKAPSMKDPAAPAGSHAAIGTFSATGGVRLATLGWTVNTANHGWGVMIFRSATADFDAGFDNLIAVVPCMDADTYDYIDSPLAAGTYYYDWIGFTYEGDQSTEYGEQSAIVTDT